MKPIKTNNKIQVGDQICLSVVGRKDPIEGEVVSWGIKRNGVNWASIKIERDYYGNIDYNIININMQHIISFFVGI